MVTRLERRKGVARLLPLTSLLQKRGLGAKREFVMTMVWRFAKESE